MIKILMFQGGEGVGEDNVTWLTDWTPEAVEAAFVEYHGEDWADEITDMFVGGNVALRETIDVMNDHFAQAVTDGVDGGMTYLVRIS